MSFQNRVFPSSWVHWALAGAVAMLAGCATLEPQDAYQGDAAGLRFFPPQAGQTTVNLAASDDAIVVLASEAGRLIAIDADSDARVTLGPVGGESARVRDARLVMQGDYVLALWKEVTRSDTDDGGEVHHTYARLSSDDGRSFAEAMTLGGDDTVVAGAEIALDADGALLLLAEEWTRDKPQRPVLALYRLQGETLRRSVLAEGETGDNWLQGRIVVDGQRVVVGWLAVRGASTMELRHVESLDGGTNWSEVGVAHAGNQIVGPQLLRSGNATLYYWMDAGWGTLRGLALADGEGEWRRVEGLPARPDGLLSGYRMTVAPDGAVHLLYGLRREQGDREAVYYRRSDDGRHFGDTVLLSATTPAHSSTADWPSLAVDDAGRLLAVWHDLRHFRPTIYGNVSEDGGRTWLEQPVPLSANPGRRFAMFPVLAAKDEGRFALAWTEYTNTKREQPRTALAVVDLDAGIGFDAPQPDLERLEMRINAYWQLRVQGDVAATLPMYDPFYRDRQTLEGHVSSRTRFKVLIHDFRIEETETLGLGRVRVKIAYEHEVKPFRLPDGKMAEVPRDWVDTDQEWIWIDGDWYLVYLDIMRRPVLEY